MNTAPFRAEVIGSLLRPQKLLDARAKLEGDQYATVKGSRSFAELKAIEDVAYLHRIAGDPDTVPALGEIVPSRGELAEA